MPTKEELKQSNKMPGKTKAMFLLKSALEFNANIMIIATQVVAAGDDIEPRWLEKSLKDNFENYRTTLEIIMKS